MFKSFIFCPYEFCIDTFESEESLNTHILLARHTTKENCLRSKDKAKLILFEKIKNVDGSFFSSFRPTSTTISPILIPRHYKIFTEEGWALRTRKPYKPIDKAVKAYIKSIFEEEKLYGNLFFPMLLVSIQYLLLLLTYRSKNANGRICHSYSDCSQSRWNKKIYTCSIFNS